MVATNVTPRLIDALVAETGRLMGSTEHEVYHPYEKRKADYYLATKPTIQVEVDSVKSDLEDPQSMVSIIALVRFTLTVRQKLIDHASAGYSQVTFYRVWDICDYLAGRFHRSRLVNDQIGVTDITEIDVTPTAQENIDGVEGKVIGVVRVSIGAQRNLETTEEFRRTFAPQLPEDADVITSTEVDTTWR